MRSVAVIFHEIHQDGRIDRSLGVEVDNISFFVDDHIPGDAVNLKILTGL